MAQDEHGARARRHRAKRDVRTTDGRVLSHVQPVRWSDQASRTVLGLRQGGRIASSRPRVDLLVGDDRVGGRSAVHSAAPRLPR